MVIIVFLNVILLREHFRDASFSETLLSMLTVDPGSPFSKQCNLAPAPAVILTPSPSYTPSPAGFEEDNLVPAPAAEIPGSPAVLPSPTPAPIVCPSSIPVAPAPSPTTTQCSNDGLLDSLKRTIKADINDAISQLKLQELQKTPQVTPAPAARTQCTDQGIDYNQVKDDTCGMLIHPPFDPNEYIRKDEIPCWGCSLPD